MKLITFLFLALSLSLVACNKPRKTSLEEEGLKGKVKFVRANSYDAVEKFGVEK